MFDRTLRMCLPVKVLSMWGVGGLHSLGARDEFTQPNF